MVTDWAPCELLFVFDLALSSKVTADPNYQLPFGVTRANVSMFMLSVSFIKSAHA